MKGIKIDIIRFILNDMVLLLSFLINEVLSLLVSYIKIYLLKSMYEVYFSLTFNKRKFTTFVTPSIIRPSDIFHTNKKIKLNVYL